MTSLQKTLQLQISPEQRVLDTGLQPFLYRAAGGRLVLQAQLEVTLGVSYPGIWGTVISDDGGHTWQAWEGQHPFTEGCAAALSDGTTQIYEWSARGPFAGGIWQARRWISRDGCRTLDGPALVPVHVPRAKGGFDDDGHPAAEIFLHRSLLELPSGELLLSAYGWFEEDTTPSTYRPQMNRLRCFLLRSPDRGDTWQYGTTIAVDPEVGEESYNEPVLLRINHGPHTGRLLCWLRTGSNKTYQHNPLYQTHSDDDGKTWSQPQPLPAENVDPDLQQMADGTIVATWGWRTMESREHFGPEPKIIGEGHGNYLAFSRDGGDTWESITQVTAEPSSCYTTIIEVTPGELLMVYDIGDGWLHQWRDYPGIARAIGYRHIRVG